ESFGLIKHEDGRSQIKKRSNQAGQDHFDRRHTIRGFTTPGFFFFAHLPDWQFEFLKPGNLWTRDRQPVQHEKYGDYTKQDRLQPIREKFVHFSLLQPPEV